MLQITKISQILSLASARQLILYPNENESVDKYEENKDSLWKLYSGYIAAWWYSSEWGSGTFSQNLIVISQLGIEISESDNDAYISFASLFKTVGSFLQWKKMFWGTQKHFIERHWLFMSHGTILLLLSSFSVYLIKKIMKNIYVLQSKKKKEKRKWGLKLSESKAYVGILMKFEIVTATSYRFFVNNSSKYFPNADIM